MLQHADQDSLQDMNIAALIESNKNLQRSIDELRADYRETNRQLSDSIKALQDAMSERARDSAEAREKLSNRLSTNEAEMKIVKWILGTVGVAMVGLVVETLSNRLGG